MGSNPTMRQKQLAEALRELRENVSLTIEEAAAELRTRTPKSQRWSKSKLSRVERRQQFVPPNEVEQLLDLYKVTDERTRDTLLQLAREARETGWWQKYPLSRQLQSYVGQEQAALTVREYQLGMVPGLLQIADYARALIQAIDPNTPPEVLESLVAARMVRQRTLSGEEPLHLQTIIDEAVLRRPVAQPRVMRNQLEHLLDAAQLPNVTVRVLPLAKGPHPGVEGSFTILTLPDPDGDTGYTDGIQGPVFLEDQDDIRRCNLRWGMLSAIALDPVESMNSLNDLRTEYK